MGIHACSFLLKTPLWHKLCCLWCRAPPPPSLKKPNIPLHRLERGCCTEMLSLLGWKSSNLMSEEVIQAIHSWTRRKWNSRAFVSSSVEIRLLITILPLQGCHEDQRTQCLESPWPSTCHTPANRNWWMGASKGNYRTMDSSLWWAILEVFPDQLTIASRQPYSMEKDHLVLKRTGALRQPPAFCDKDIILFSISVWRCITPGKGIEVLWGLAGIDT